MKVISITKRDQLVRQLLSSAPADKSLQIEPEERDIPIHDAPHVRIAIMNFYRFKFPSESVRREAAKRIANAAERHGIV